ncbi:MAG: alpha/beta hydrolase-fold protein [Planctomycetota bacterium]
MRPPNRPPLELDARLIALGPNPTPQAIDTLLEEHEVPLVDGRKVTFVYRGPESEVELVHWIYGLENSQPLQRLGSSDLFALQLDIPRHSRVEYKFAVSDGGRPRLVSDPLNPQSAHDPFGSNSVVHGEGYELPEWAFENEDARKGEIRARTFRSRALGGPRTVEIYLPARFRETRRYPLLCVHDGLDFVRFAALKTALDNLIHRQEIPPLIAVLTQSPDRLNEYADDARHAEFLCEELLPALETEFPLARDPSDRTLMGASFGAVASLAAAWRHPGRFGNLFLLSGSFVFTDIGKHDRGPVFDPVVEFTQQFRRNPGRPADRVFVCCGTYESLIYYNRSLLPVLQSTGMDVRFEESRDGHNWENWRDRLRDGLTFLHPGPLWFVYE